MKNQTFFLLLLIAVTGCTASDPLKYEILENQQFELANIEFRKQGVSPDDRPYMKEICRGFLLSENQIKSFFNNAEVIKEAELSDKIKMLPCHSVGTIKINDEKYSWVIRAGGIGEFFNDNNKFYKVCGKECCEKNPGLC